MPTTIRPRLLIDTIPLLASELAALLVEAGEAELAAQISRLAITDRCRCIDEFCATFYTAPKPIGSYGPNHRNVALMPDKGQLILDVVSGKVVCVEVLYREEIRKVLLAAIP